MRKLILLTLLLLNFSDIIGQTYFQGGIYSNTVWKKDKSPYIITGDVVLFPSKTLTIEPGVEVLFEGDYNLEIRGKLITVGTELMPVIFTSNLSNSKKIDWSIIFNVDLGASANCRYTNFSYANIANIIKSSEVYYNALNGIQFNNCNFMFNGTAIYTPINNNYLTIGTTSIDSCCFSNNDNAILGNGWNISNSKFTNNVNGIYESAMAFIKKSLFQNNSNCAIYAINGSIDSCIINSNNIGILNHYYAENIITNNVISGNLIGLEFSEPVQSSIFGYWHISPKNNIISNNLEYNVENLSDRTKDLTGNYWGTSDSTIIEDKIKDGYDNIKLGLVNYDIYDNERQIIKSVIKDDFTKITNIFSQNSYIVYPTIVSSEIKVEKTSTDNTPYSVSIYNIQGKVIYNSSKNINDLIINVNNFIQGMYIIKINCGSNTYRQKIIKK